MQTLTTTRHWLARALGAALFCVVLMPAGAQVQIRFEPEIVSVAVGATQIVEVRVSGLAAPGLAAFEIDAVFDDGIASFSDPNAGFTHLVEPYAPLGGNPLCTSVRGTATCEDPPWQLTNSGRTAVFGLADDTQADFKRVVYGSIGSQAAPVADGALLLLEVNGVADGAAVVDLAGILAAHTYPPSALTLTTRPLYLTVGPFVDTDSDGISDGIDNCTAVANLDQRDTNGDGFGNRCDPDLNNDGIVNTVDLGLFKLVFFSADADADFDGNGIVNVVDLGVLKTLFFMPPGPSGLAP